MNRGGARARVRRARTELDQAELQLAARWRPWRERLRRHRLSLLVGGGLLGGFALVMTPPRWWSRIGAALFGGSAWLASSPVGPAVLGVLWTNIFCSPDPSRPHPPDSARAGPPADE
jgi:hypothetical protein